MNQTVRLTNAIESLHDLINDVVTAQLATPSTASRRQSSVATMAEGE